LTYLHNERFWDGKDEDTVTEEFPVYKCDRRGDEFHWFVCMGLAIPPAVSDVEGKDCHICNKCSLAMSFEHFRVEKDDLMNIVFSYQRHFNLPDEKLYEFLKSTNDLFLKLQNVVLKPRKKITAKLRRDMINDAGNKCYYCGDLFKNKYLHIEHKTPISRGGLSNPGNLCVACKDCNMKKGVMTEKEFKKHLKSNGIDNG